jgi:hypothetical protein
MEELVCGVCYERAPGYIRQCRCLYCPPCKQKNPDLCTCGGTGVWLDLTHKVPEYLKYLNCNDPQILKKTIENTLENTLHTISASFGFLYNTLELKNHYFKQTQKNLMEKLKKYQDENQDLKKNTVESPPLQIKDRNCFEGMDSVKFSTPRGVRLITPLSASKKLFDLEAFDSFFSKKDQL